MVRRRSAPRAWTDDESRILVDMMLCIGDVGERWEENIEMLPIMLQLGNTDLRLTQDQVEEKINSLKMEYFQLKEMLMSSLLHWDEVNHMVKGDPEALDLWCRIWFRVPLRFRN
ncbi:hypothetical protein COLO4_28109 [Corchorus olitorius]|uniref:Myb/SANT-like domain-containing protein n=1 Tax=Corchorus olitorius TaxID=93759 RepID=A0A1R3HN03_9ROSI|nr:hypothetical protein COLO4_28109 [Corchorus olitorius]